MDIFSYNRDDVRETARALLELVVEMTLDYQKDEMDLTGDLTAAIDVEEIRVRALDMLDDYMRDLHSDLRAQIQKATLDVRVNVNMPDEKQEW